MYLTPVFFTALGPALIGLSTAALTFDQMSAIKCDDKTPDSLILNDTRAGHDHVLFRYRDCNTHCSCTKGVPDKGEIDCYVPNLDTAQLQAVNRACNQAVNATAKPPVTGAGCVCAF